MGIYEDRVVCFIDILGFQEHIHRTLKPDGSENTEETARLSRALGTIRKTTDQDQIIKSKRVTQFSDSVVISFAITEESGVFWSLMEILWLQVNLIFEGILCRGGITRGLIVHTPQQLFGPALIEAYKLESAAAIYPRVILHESMIDLGGLHHARHHDSATERKYVEDLTARDSDGMHYIDYFWQAQSELDDPDCDFPEYLHRLYCLIQSGLISSDPSILVKYQWMREKYNPVVIQAKKTYSSTSDYDLKDAYDCLETF